MIEKEEYFDRVYGCYLGKNIGGTIGTPLEGNKEFLTIPFKEPSELLANDDLDLQLVYLDILMKKGIKITSYDLADGWLNNITYPFDEYGVAIANLKAGLKPPVTGYYNNWFQNCMGAPIRSEIWACIAPGKPEIAGWYAYQDASIDHWNEGVYGEIFLATLESIAFFDSSLLSIIKKALSFIPCNSMVYQVVELTQSLYKHGKSLKETRETILQHFGHYNFTDCVQNIGFIIAGLLYGEGDFLKTIISAVRCGYDTDCTGATAGAIIGIMLGREKILKEGYADNDKIVAGWGIKNIYVPETLKELTEEVIKTGYEVIKSENELSKISLPFTLPQIPEFHQPFKFPFLVSESFSIDESGRMEKSMLDGTCNGFKKVIFNSSFFDLNPYFKRAPSSLFLRTVINMKENRKVKLFPASTDGIKMWVDGKLVLSHHQHNNFLPAPHRPGSPLAEIELKKGKHPILLEIIRCNEKLEFGWIIADESNHLITDIEYISDKKVE